jgi:hypothetical protein
VSKRKDLEDLAADRARRRREEREDAARRDAQSQSQPDRTLKEIEDEVLRGV